MKLNCPLTLLIGAIFFMITKLCDFFFIFRARKKIGDGYIWCWFCFFCPCFVSDVQHAIARSTKNYEIGSYVNGKHVVKNFENDYFKNEKSVFVCCFDHLVDDMRFDTKNCVSILNTTPKGFFFECNSIVLVIKPKSAISFIE